MVRLIPIQEAYKAKIERQQKLAGLKFRCHGSCAYIGEDISPGCYGCFYSGAYFCGFMLGRDFGLPDICNRNCVYCFEPHEIGSSSVVPETWSLDEEWKQAIVDSALEKKMEMGSEASMQYYEFSGVCEPLLYLHVLTELMDFLRNVIDPLMGTRGWAKVYTNGTLLDLDNISNLKNLGMDEVRIHPAADNFSDEVFNNTRLAVNNIPTVTIETPSWPPHRENLFEMLPVLQDIGIKHLNICQVEVASQQQLQKIEKSLGEIELYQAFYPVLDDGGLVEDVITEVLEKGYSYSVLDCNGFVKQSRSALSRNSYWNLLNSRFPPDWVEHRQSRLLKREK
jgi:pyruvate formate-lyase activating enzyme-like uncharacterized protein